MATEKAIQPATEMTGPTCMHSVNRLSKLPAVESTIQTATSLYEKVKEYNTYTNSIFSTAENTYHKAVEVGKPYATPVLSNLEGPIKKVDDLFCTGLDYVEDKVPAIKLPPTEIYTSTKGYVNNTVTPVVESAYTYVEQAKEIVEPRIKQAREYVDPAIEQAKSMVEPRLEAARTMVEPLVQPAMDRANQLKDYGMQKVDEYLHRGHTHENEGDCVECEECQEIKKNVRKQEN